MPIINRQEKIILIFLLCIALVGIIIGIFRHNLLQNSDILLSPNNLPEVKLKTNEAKIIAEHNQVIKNEQTNIPQDKNDINNKVSVSKNEIIEEFDKTKSIEKNVTKNTSGLININIASKEDFMALPYIGEVKAERIIQLRNEMGVFTSIKDLEKVSGIGPKTLAKIEPYITI